MVSQHHVSIFRHISWLLGGAHHLGCRNISFCIDVLMSLELCQATEPANACSYMCPIGGSRESIVLAHPLHTSRASGRRMTWCMQLENVIQILLNTCGGNVLSLQGNSNQKRLLLQSRPSAKTSKNSIVSPYVAWMCKAIASLHSTTCGLCMILSQGELLPCFLSAALTSPISVSWNSIWKLQKNSCKGKCTAIRSHERRWQEASGGMTPNPCHLSKIERGPAASVLHFAHSFLIHFLAKVATMAIS